MNIELIIQYKANVNAQLENGYTALMIGFIIF
jgi:hypothetical protein